MSPHLAINCEAKIIIEAELEEEDRKLQKKKISKWHLAIWCSRCPDVYLNVHILNVSNLPFAHFCLCCSFLVWKEKALYLGLLSKTGTKTSHSFSFRNSLSSYREHNSPSIPKSFCKWSSFLLALAPGKMLLKNKHSHNASYDN